MNRVKTAFNLTLAAALIFVAASILGGLCWLCVEMWQRIL